jgi:hypothetical protein
VFIEPMPLLAGRTVLITVAREDEKTIRVCVIQRRSTMMTTCPSPVCEPPSPKIILTWNGLWYFI